jgi:outer membrane protein assembly factor BamB
MARLVHRQDRHNAFRLGAYWDTLVRQRPALPVPSSETPPGPAAIVRQLHTQEEADTRRPAFEADLLQSLLATYGQDATVTVTASPSRHVPAATRKHAGSIVTPVRRYAMPALEIALIVALILASIAGIWLTTGRNDGSQIFAPPTEATPSVPMYRGNPARTGEMPGPGIEGEPVVLHEFAITPGGFWKPVFSGNTIYSNGGHSFEGVFAIDTRSGDVQWEISGTSWANSGALSLIDDTVYAVDLVGTMFALDAGTGTERWRVEGLRLRSGVQMAVADGVAYVVGEDGNVYALDAASGTTIWHRQIPGAMVEYTALADGVVYLGTVKGQIYALDAADGTDRWQSEISLGSSTLDGLAVANGLVYVSANNPVRRADAGFALALDATTGEVAWRVDAEPQSGFTLLAVDENAAYLTGARGDLNVNALNAFSGTSLWTNTLESPVDGAPALVDHTLYLGTLDGVLHALDTASGTKLWRMDFEGEFASAPIVAGGLLYIGTLAGSLYVIGGSDAEAAIPAPAAGAIPGQHHRAITRNHSSPA